MRQEIKHAGIIGGVIVALVVGVGLYFMSLDQTAKVVQFTPLQPKSNQTISNQATSNQNLPDESQYPLAPNLVGISGYVNTTPEELQNKTKDKVVLYDFWTYSCINCIRTFPYLKAWNEKYADKGLVIVGIHSPEFEFEKDINNVKMATAKYGLTYPVVLDSDHKTWDAFSNRYWPAEYIVDYRGHIRHTHFGEGNYDETEKVIQELLDERSQQLGLNVNMNQSLVNITEHQFGLQQTPELYFGYSFSIGRSFIGNHEGFQPEQTVVYTLPETFQQDHFYLDGKWDNFADSMKLESADGKIVLPYYAKDVHIVASGPGTDIQIQVDGKPLTLDNAGLDTKNSQAHIAENRLYNLVLDKSPGGHILTITAHPGFTIFTFTFG